MTRLRLTAAAVSALVVACSSSAAAAPGSGAGTAPIPDTVFTLEVSGSADVRIPADRARITFAVETEDTTARGASAQNARRMDEAISALRAADVEGLEIATRGYELQPRYRRPDDRGTREIDGYRARNLVEVTVPGVDAVGRLIDAAVGAGANRVASLVFEASETEEARLRALDEAVRQARRQAETVAAAMGLRLGRAVQVQTGSNLPGPIMRFRAEAMAAQAPTTPIEPGEQSVSATVTIRYELEER